MRGPENSKGILASPKRILANPKRFLASPKQIPAVDGQISPSPSVLPHFEQPDDR